MTRTLKHAQQRLGKAGFQRVLKQHLTLATRGQGQALPSASAGHGHQCPVPTAQSRVGKLSRAPLNSAPWQP